MIFERVRGARTIGRGNLWGKHEAEDKQISATFKFQRNGFVVIKDNKTEMTYSRAISYVYRTI